MQDSSNKIIQSLWVGKSLSPIEELCIKSYLRNGHEFHLYVYNNIKNIPSGTVVKDANEIVLKKHIFYYQIGAGKGSVGGFADLFRYKLLFLRGGWWSDMDVVCMKHFDFSDEYVYAKEKNKRTKVSVNCHIIKCPVESKVMQECVEKIKKQDSNRILFGEMWPKLLNSIVGKSGLLKYARPYEYFSPIGWFEFNKLFNRLNLPIDCYSVHMFNEMWRRYNISKYKIFSSKSFIENMKNRFMVNNHPLRYLLDELFRQTPKKVFHPKRTIRLLSGHY